MNKTRSLRLNDDQWQSLEKLAQSRGLNRNAFIAAIADGTLTISDNPNVNQRIDKLRDRVALLERQRRVDQDKLTDALLQMNGYSTAPHVLP